MFRLFLILVGLNCLALQGSIAAFQHTHQPGRVGMGRMGLKGRGRGWFQEQAPGRHAGHEFGHGNFLGRRSGLEGARGVGLRGFGMGGPLQAVGAGVG